MLLLGLVLAQVSTFAPPVPWALNFGAAPRIPLVGDADGDGLADLIAVYPIGDGIIDISLNVGGMKAGYPSQGLTSWGKDCQAAVAGEFDSTPGVDVAGVFEGQNLRLAHSYKDGRFTDEPQWVRLPSALKQPSMAMRGSSILVWSGRKGYLVDPAHKSVATAKGPFPQTERPEKPIVREGDMDGDGDLDQVQFDRVTEHFAGNEVSVIRRISPGEDDSDGDGLTNEKEAEVGSDPLNPDTDNDGLLDGWETGSFRGLDFKALGCSPLHVDLVCLTSRFTNADEAMVKRTMDRVKGYYASLQSKNPDGTTGWALHTVELAPVPDADQKKSWWELRDKFLPAKWKGMVHWMQLTPWGGGQADQLGDGGGCGGNDDTLYATFIHEFGHQLGLSHEGFYQAAWCPTFPSMMNYAYSYGYEDDIKKIRYSDGALKNYLLTETDLDETIPLPIDQVRFLSHGPYHYRLKPAGAKTLIDWNWNGVFGEKHVRADINYSYSTSGGVRDEIDKTNSAPWLFSHRGHAYLLFARHSFPADIKTDPSIGPEKPGSLLLRRMVKPKEWKPAETIETGGVIGDPVAVSFQGKIYAAYATTSGVVVRAITDTGDSLQMSSPYRMSTDRSLVPTLAVYRNRLLLFLWSPANGEVIYGKIQKGRLVAPQRLNFTSTVPLGSAVDCFSDELVIGLAQDQDSARPSRWQIRRFGLIDERLTESSREWIEGEKGGARGRSRPVLVFDPDKRESKSGRLYFFGLGLTSKETPWSCVYASRQIGDKSVNGGWQTVRFYDEWTQSRSAPAAMWFNGDILYAYRWVDGGQTERDNLLHVAYHATGIETQPMGDFDDIGYMREFGIRHSILWMREDG